jgi:thiamine-monophosphate kinase
LGLGLPKNWQEDWVKRFAQGLGAACARYECPLLGGDTISALESPVLSLTALGSVANGQALLRSKAQVGDSVFVSGTIGLAGMGLRVLMGESATPAQTKAWVNRYQCPEPRLALGEALLGLAHGCVDVSDGVFADARHIATASQLCIEIDVQCLPVPEGVDPLVAATCGDDYELLFTLPAQKEPAIFTLSQRLGLKITRIGRCLARQRQQDPFLVAVDGKGQRVTPTRLGYEHP